MQNPLLIYSAQMHDMIVTHPILSSLQKSKCALVFADVDKALSDGADEELQLLEVGMRMFKILK